MQTQQVLKTIEWLDRKFGEINKILEAGMSRGPEVPAELSVVLANRIGRFADAVEQNPDAVTGLKGI